MINRVNLKTTVSLGLAVFILGIFSQTVLAALPPVIPEFGYGIAAGGKLTIGNDSEINQSEEDNVASVISGYDTESKGRLKLGTGAVVNGEVHSYDYITTGNDIEINGAMTWATGNITFGNNTKAKSVYSAAKLKIGKNSIVNGFAMGQAGSQIDPSTVPDSTVGALPAMGEPQPVFLPSFEEVKGKAYKTRSYSKKNINEIDPGIFGTVKIRNKAEATFSSGTYSFNKLYFREKSNIFVDTTEGDVIWEIAKVFRTSRLVNIVKIGDNDLIILSGGDITIGSYNVIEAEMASADDIRINSHSQITGKAYAADDVTVGKQVAFNSTAVPEPTTLVLLLAASPLLLRKRK
ncbi:MAG: PEP-CTERM sorting domain-containing protein [Phycisphaerae bacterium]|nr:PEP-CTERM sorting domain-containing protein [Phycisphaerae bacterium]